MYSAPSLQLAVAAVVEYQESPNAVALWGVTSDSEEPLVALVRYRAGVGVPQSQRVVHAIEVPPGTWQRETVLPALCDTSLDLVATELVELGGGAPCEWCVGRARSHVIERSG